MWLELVVGIWTVIQWWWCWKPYLDEEDDDNSNDENFDDNYDDVDCNDDDSNMNKTTFRRGSLWCHFWLGGWQVADDEFPKIMSNTSSSLPSQPSSPSSLIGEIFLMMSMSMEFSTGVILVLRAECRPTLYDNWAFLSHHHRRVKFRGMQLCRSSYYSLLLYLHRIYIRRVPAPHKMEQRRKQINSNARQMHIYVCVLQPLCSLIQPNAW